MEYIIDHEYLEVRIDKFIRKKYPLVQLSEIFKGFRIGKIKINGKKTKENYRLKVGDIVKVYFGDEKKEVINFVELLSNEKAILAEGIVFENKDLIIFYKKSNMVMHKGSGHPYGLAEMFKSYYRNNRFNFVNRIDKDTSGLVIGAKSLEAGRKLSEEMQKRNLVKKYYILVEGRISKKKFYLESYLKKEETHVNFYDKEQKNAKRALTYFETVKYNDKYSLLIGELETGRTHQLRVQLSHMGYPIVGDKKYGSGMEKEMYLFSYFVKIPLYEIEIEMPIPKKFLEKLK